MFALNTALSEASFLESLTNKTLWVISPASGPIGNSMDNIPFLLKSFKKAGIHIRFSRDFFNFSIPYHANSDEARSRQLQEALTQAQEGDIIWAFRGGYGSARLLDALQKLPPIAPKILIGFSDITALHLFLHQKWGWSTIHGAGFGQLLNTDHINDPCNFTQMADMLLNKTRSPLALSPLNKAAEQQTQSISGPLTGGNLTLVENSLSTFWEVKAENKIIILEEVGEKGYRIDRILYHLYEAKIFEKVKAVILGEFLAPCDEELFVVQLAIERFSKSLSIPVYQTNKIGHGVVNVPWCYGATAKIAENKLYLY